MQVLGRIMRDGLPCTVMKLKTVHYCMIVCPCVCPALASPHALWPFAIWLAHATLPLFASALQRDPLGPTNRWEAREAREGMEGEAVGWIAVQQPHIGQARRGSLDIVRIGGIVE